MNIALVKPNSNHLLSHRVRGAGIYAENLTKSLKEYSPKDNFIETTWDKVPQDVDVCHFLYFEPFFLTLPLQKKGRTVVTVHDLIPFVFPKYFPKGVKGELKWQIQKALLKRCDVIITDSENSKKDILRFVEVKENKVHTIYLAVDSNFKKINDSNKLDNVRSKYNLPENFALYVGDVTWNKNLPRLIEATKKASVPLVMVGKALSSENFDKRNPWNRDLAIVKEEIKKRKDISILGFVEKDELIALYNLAKVFVMPSLYEGFGLPIIEAMSCGCPVVTSKTGSISEVAGESVYYVDPNDTQNIAKGILKVYSNKDLQKKLSQKGLIQAGNFSWEKTAEETIRIYKSLC